MIRDSLKKYKAGIIFLGDIAAFFGSLALTLYIRYGHERYLGAFKAHVHPFELLLVLWLFVFYVADLYAYTAWRTTLENTKRFAAALVVNFFLSISIFYLFSQFFKLTPKLNLIIFSIVFGVIDYAWRYLLARVLTSKSPGEKVIVAASTQLAHDIIAHVKKYPELGYTIVLCATADEVVTALSSLGEKATIVVDTTMIKDTGVMTTLYGKLSDHVRIETFADFYGSLFGRMPLAEVAEGRFIEQATAGDSIYDMEKRVIDVALSLFLIILFSPLFILFYILITVTSKGSAIYRQTRVGKGGVSFTLYKFRSMRIDAEKDGPVWWKKDDDRTTRVGAFLRRTHFDEIPQLWNILKGDMSFVGPRPERPEFAATLQASLPHYLVRQTILPGLTGWAQIKFRYASTVVDWQEKLEYDLYYVSKRNLFMDIEVTAKTVRFVFKR